MPDFKPPEPLWRSVLGIAVVAALFLFVVMPVFITVIFFAFKWWGTVACWVHYTDFWCRS